MKGHELIPEDVEYVCRLDTGEVYEDAVQDYALDEDIAVGETFDFEMFGKDGGKLCNDNGDFYEVDQDCDCDGQCRKIVDSISVFGVATFKVLNEDKDLEIVQFIPNK